jgi:acyl phosphate:glycerol-3-phosphate acyltransferase
MIRNVLLVLAAYLLGAIPFGLLIARLQKGIDIRDHGSGNIGTSNVLRTSGKRAALLTLAGDLLKGYLPVLAGSLWGVPPPWVVIAGAAAVIGHNWPIYIHFRGGKGVATSFGAALGIMPAAAGLALLVYLLVAAIARYTSLAALVSTASLLLWVHLFRASRPQVLFSVFAALLIYLRHRENIQRLILGTERKIGQRVQV